MPLSRYYFQYELHVEILLSSFSYDMNITKVAKLVAMAEP